MWLGHHAGHGLDVAIKVMTGRQVLRPHSRDAFRTEVRAVAGLDHPAIVRVFDHGEIPPSAERASGGRLTCGTPYLVMELVRGGSLRTVQPRSWPELRSALLELLEALAHAHARGVTHRDLKPGNVLVAAPDEAGAGLRITDFGLAALIDDPSIPLRSRFIMGTLQYMAPEQVSGHLRDIGPWTDLYSLGCIGWRLGTGARAFESDDTRELIRQQLEEPPPPFLPYLPAPEGLEGWLLRLLHKDPARRFQRAGDAAWALLQLGEARTTGEAPPIEGPAHTTGSYKRLSGGRPLSWTGWASRVSSVSAVSDRASVEPDEVTASGMNTAGGPSRPRGGGPGWTDPLPPLPDDWRELHRGRAEASPLGVGLGLLGLRSNPLVGRTEERDRLWSTLRTVVETGQTRALVLTGPSGIGKSRLVQWLAEAAHETGHGTILRATHSQIPGPTDGLGPMVGRHLGCVGLTRAEVSQRVRRVLTRVGVDDPWEWAAIAEIASPTRGASPTGAAAAESADPGPVVRFGRPAEWFAVLQRLIDYEARRRPIVLWLADLQWSESSAEFARQLLDQHGRRPVLIVCTTRTSAGPAPAWVQTLSDSPWCEELEVPPLPRSAQSDLLSALLGLAPRVASEVLRRTEGRPLYATQLLGDWVRRGVLTPTPDGYTVPDAELALPESVHTLQARRLDRVLVDRGEAADGRAVIELAAALGRSVATAEWEPACGAAGLSVPDGLLRALIDDGLAETEPEGWRFTHNVLRDAVEREAVSAGRWARWNSVVFDTLEQQLDPDRAAAAERLARHALAAERWRDGLTWLERAARVLRRLGSYDRAAALLVEHAELRAAQGLDEADPASLTARALAPRILASRGRYERSEELTRGVIADARAAGVDAALAEALRHLGFMAWQKARPDEARTAYREALLLDRAAGNEADAARCLLGLGVVRFRADGDLDGAGSVFQQALGMFAHLDEGRGIVDALGWLAILERRRGNFSAGRDLQKQALATARGIGHRFGEMMALNSIGDASRLLAEHDEAERCYRESLAIARSTGSGEQVWPQLNLGLTLLDRGRYLEAEDLLDRSRSRLDQMGRRAFVGCVHAALVPCAAARGDWEEFDAHFGQARRILGETGMVDADVVWPLERAASLARDAAQDVRSASAAQFAADQRAALEST